MVGIQTVTVVVAAAAAAVAVSVVGAFEGMSTASHGAREPWAVDSLRNSIVGRMVVEAHAPDGEDEYDRDRDPGVIGECGDWMRSPLTNYPYPYI